MRAIDYAYTRTKPVTKRMAILSALDAFISGLILLLFLGVTFFTIWMIFGH